jgi:hypothetical protein
MAAVVKFGRKREALKIWPVDRMVGNVRNNGPQLILQILSNPQ